MPLWNKTDATISRPNWIDLALYPAGTQLLYVDDTEALVESNKTKGIKGPGWYLYREYTDSVGQTRYKTELVVAIADSTGAGDAADDLFVPDAEVTVAISVQPANQTTVSGAATFGVTAALTPAGTVTYQWQYQAADETAAWAVLSGETAATLVLAAQTIDNDGDKYRVVVGGAGAKAVISDVATLTFGD